MRREGLDLVPIEEVRYIPEPRGRCCIGFTHLQVGVNLVQLDADEAGEYHLIDGFLGLKF